MSDTPSLELQVATLRAAVRRADPHASVEHDAFNGILRVRSELDATALARLAEALDIDLASRFARLDLRPRGSDCCGGCG